MSNKLILLPLVLILSAALFYHSYLFAGNSLGELGGDAGGWLERNVTLPDTMDRQTGLTLDGELSEVELDITSKAVAGTLLDSSVLVVTFALTAVIGCSVTILGSGLSGQGTKAIGAVLFYYGMWAIVSYLGLEAYQTIPLLGLPLYFILTFVYGLGVWEKVQ